GDCSLISVRSAGSDRLRIQGLHPVALSRSNKRINATVRQRRLTIQHLFQAINYTKRRMAMVLQVNGYALSYNIKTNKGTLFLHFTTNQQVPVEVDSAQELMALADILRTAANLFYDPTEQILSTPIKPP